MNEHITRFRLPDHSVPNDATLANSTGSDRTIAVGDVYIRRAASGFGIFNYRGEPVLDAPLRTSDEAARMAREIVSSWQGHVVVDDDDPSDG